MFFVFVWFCLFFFVWFCLVWLFCFGVLCFVFVFLFYFYFILYQNEKLYLNNFNAVDSTRTLVQNTMEKLVENVIRVSALQKVLSYFLIPLMRKMLEYPFIYSPSKIFV